MNEVHISVDLSIRLSISLSTHTSTCLSISLSIRPRIDLSFYAQVLLISQNTAITEEQYFTELVFHDEKLTQIILINL